MKFNPIPFPYLKHQQILKQSQVNYYLMTNMSTKSQLQHKEAMRIYTWYWLTKRAMSNPSVGMVPRTEAWALRAGEEMHTACTTMVDGMTTLSEWKYRDLRNGSMKILERNYQDPRNGTWMEILRLEDLKWVVLKSEQQKYQTLRNGSTDIWRMELWGFGMDKQSGKQATCSFKSKI